MLSDVEEDFEQPLASTSYLPPIIQQSPKQQTNLNSSRVSSSPLKASTTIGSGNKNASNNSVGSAGTRLLWRGKLMIDFNKKKVLNGIAIVAHLFSVPLVSPNIQTKPLQPPSPFDDPFSSHSSSSSNFSSASDLCLGLEMMRGGNIKVLGEMKVKLKDSEEGKGKGKGKENQGMNEMEVENQETNEEEDYIEVETPSDIRIYIDKRCPETVDWFESQFCLEGKESIGIQLEVAGEEVIIFASYPELPTELQGDEARPALTLLLGRRSQLKARKPRPDDPMPRENLFANILRRTNSLPVLNFQHPNTNTTNSTTNKKRATLSRSKSTKSNLLPSHTLLLQSQQNSSSSNNGGKVVKESSSSRRRNSKSSQSLVNLLNGEKEKDITASSSSSISRNSTSMATTAILQTNINKKSVSSSSSSSRERAPLSRSGSTRDLFSSTSSSSTTSSTSNQIQHNSSNSNNSKRPSLKRSRTVSDLISNSNSNKLNSRNLITDEEEQGEDEDNFFNFNSKVNNSKFNMNSYSSDEEATVGGLKRLRRFSNQQAEMQDEEEDDEFGFGFVPGSPTPSITTTAFNGGELEDELTMEDIKRSGSIEPTSNSSRTGSFNTSTSGRSKMQRSFSVPVGVLNSTSKLLHATATSGHGNLVKDDSSLGIETRNRATVRKVVLTKLITAGISREDERFKDIFSMTSKGVQFALRNNYKTILVDKELVNYFTEIHLNMYLGKSSSSSSTSSTSSTSPDVNVVVKHEDEEGSREGTVMKVDEKDLPPSPKSVEE